MKNIYQEGINKKNELKRCNKLKSNNKGFALISILLFISVFGSIMMYWMSSYNNINQQIHLKSLQLQSVNLTSEALELTKGFIMTELNKNVVDAWDDKIEGLNGNYIVSYDNVNWYKLVEWEEEVIEQDYPFSNDYIRRITITDWVDSNEKKVVVSVQYWDNEDKSIKFETIITNNYSF